MKYRYFEGRWRYIVGRCWCSGSELFNLSTTERTHDLPRSKVVSQARGLNFSDRLAEAVRLLEAETPARRAATAAALQSSDLRVTLINDDQVSPHSPRGQIQATLAARLGSEREIRSVGGGMGGGGMGMGGGGMQRGGGMMQGGQQQGLRSFEVRLNDGQWVRSLPCARATRRRRCPPT